MLTAEQEQRLLAYFEKFISNCRHVDVDPSEAAVELQPRRPEYADAKSQQGCNKKAASDTSLVDAFLIMLSL